MPDLVYIIGEPGAGKSTALAAITARLTGAVLRKPFAHTEWWLGGDPVVVELGYRRAAFSGTDTLSLSVQPTVLRWLAETNHRNVVGEGDRLANSKFFQGAADAGWNVTIVRLDVPAPVAAARRAARAAALGVEQQNEAWLRGRITKTARLAAEWPTVTVDADGPPADVAARLAAVDAPPLRLLTSNP